MSRGGRGGFGSRGRGRGGGGSSASAMPNTGLTHEEMQVAQMRREPQPLYPAYADIPILTALSEREREACKLQLGFAERLKQSPYYLKEVHKNLDILRYSDKYKPMAKKRPLLETAPLDQKFFPKEIWGDFFAAEKAAREKKRPRLRQTNGADFRSLDLDALEDEDKEGGEDGEKRADETMEENQSDYDDDQEEFGDDDYVQNYFEAGSGDDPDDGGGDDEGGGGSYD